MSNFLSGYPSLQSLGARVKKNILTKTLVEPVIFFLLFIYFVFTRALGFHQTYHQDEYKWAMIVDPVNGLRGTVPHPPLAENLYHIAGRYFGYNHLRIVPIIVSLLLGVLIIYFVRKQYGRRAAIIAAGIFTITIYSVIASIQIDIDGALLPFFVCAAIGSYEQIRLTASAGAQKKWAALFLVACIGGFFTKLSFVLVPVAILCDVAPSLLGSLSLYKKRAATFLWAAACCVVLGGIVVVLVLIRHAIFIEYVKNFVAFSHRDFQQEAIQIIKALIFSSPLIIGGVILGVRHFRQLRIWYYLIGASFLFYLVIFDFTHRTLDRYLMFIILPGSVIAGVALAHEIKSMRIVGSEARKFLLFLGSSIVVFGTLMHYLLRGTYEILPFIPKSVFFEHVKNLNFSFLVPLTGGSGPAGFYLSARALIIFWCLGLLSVAVILLKLHARTIALAIFISAGLIYNVYGDLELLTGAYFGSMSKVIEQTTDYVVNAGDIPGVITFNDTGTWQLEQAHKYIRRFYIHPMFAVGNTNFFRAFHGYFMIVDFPPIGTSGPYAEYFSGCAVVYHVQDKLISGSVYDCRKAPFTVKFQ